MIEKLRKMVMLVVLCVSMTVGTVMPTFAAESVVVFNVETAKATYTNIEGTYLYVESGVSQDAINEAVVAWTMIPTSIQEMLIEYNCPIYVTCTSDQISSISSSATIYGNSVIPGVRYNLSSLQVTALNKDPYIVIKSNIDSITETLLHEVGHQFESTLVTLKTGYYSGSGSAYNISTTAEWQALYTEYKDKIAVLGTCARTTSSTFECFAEAFSLTLVYPEKMIETCPEVYEFIYQMIELYA